MVENKDYIVFGIIGLILAIAGAMITVLSQETYQKTYMAWALFGNGIAIIWIAFHKVCRRNKEK